MSKPKEYRVCAFCGIRQHKSNLLRITLPDIFFDFWQNKQGRSFYVCPKHTCINKVFKKKNLYKYLDESVYINLLYDKLRENIKNNIIYNINKLFEKYGINDAYINTEKLVLFRYDVLINSSNNILLDKAVYNGSKKLCIVYDKYTADKLIKYKNLITDIDGLFYGELNGVKKS